MVLINKRIGEWQKVYNKWLKQALKTDNYDGMPSGEWMHIGYQIEIAAKLHTGELTEQDLENAYRKGREEAYGDGV